MRKTRYKNISSQQYLKNWHPTWKNLLTPWKNKTEQQQIPEELKNAAK